MEVTAIATAPGGDRALPPAPSLGRAIRAGATDLFFNSWRVVPANLLVAFCLALVVWALLSLGGLVAAVVAVPVALPIAGLFRLGAMATRARDVNFSDVFDPGVESPRPILLAGAGFSFATLVLGTNLITGIVLGGIVPWVVATAAFWALLALVAFGFVFWPIAVDPERAAVRWRDRARLAGLLLLAHPARVAALAAVLIVVLAISTVAFAALATVSLGFAALVSCRYVLPAADRLEARIGGLGRVDSTDDLAADEASTVDDQTSTPAT
jgi:hypothetical protein